MAERLAVGIDEAAEMLGVGRSTLHRYVRAGLIPHVRIGRRIVIPLAALERWLNEQATHSWRSHDDPRNRPVEEDLVGLSRFSPKA